MIQNAPAQTYEGSQGRQENIVNSYETAGMTYILDLTTGRPTYIDPALSRTLSGGCEPFEFRRFRNRLHHRHEAALDAHIAQLKMLEANGAAHLVIPVQQNDAPEVWLFLFARDGLQPCGKKSASSAPRSFCRTMKPPHGSPIWRDRPSTPKNLNEGASGANCTTARFSTLSASA